MRLALVADNHFRGRERLGVMRDGQDTRLRDKLDSLQQVVDWSIKNSVDVLCHLGDAFDRPNPGDTVRAAVSEILGKYLDESEGHIIAVVGNHERIGTISPWRSESLMSENLVVAAEPQRVWCGLVNVLCLPESSKSYDPDFVKAVCAKERNGPHLIIGHGEVRGALAAENFTIDRGFDPEWLASLGAPAAFFGHFHKRQVLQQGDFRYGYVGALNRQDFAERDYETGFLVLEYTNQTLDSAEFIEVPDRPMVQLEWDETTDFVDVVSLLPPGEPLVKIKLKGRASWMHSSEVQDAIDAVTHNSMRCVIAPEIIKERVTLSLSTKGFSVDSAFALYLKENKVDEQNAVVGAEILTAAKQTS